MSQQATARRRPFMPIIHGAVGDSPDEQDTVEAAETIAAALKRLGFRTEILALGLDLSPLQALARRQPEVVVNLVDSLCGDGALFAVPAMALDHLGLRHTGADAAACQRVGDKIMVKRLLAAQGLPTPAFWTDGARPPDDVTVIVKSLVEHASIGLDAASVVPGARADAEIAAREARFGGRFFAEAFVEGREFNVALLDREGAPQVLPIPEIVFDGFPEGRPRIVDYEAKWAPESAAYRGTPRRFGLEAREPALAETLAGLAVACWDALGLGGYARVDFRVDAGGRPTILEANVNPCLAPDAGFPAAAAAAGLTYDAMVARIVAAAAPSGRR